MRCKLRQPYRITHQAFVEYILIPEQLCGINVVAYYSSKILVDAGFARSKTLYVSFGLGLTNFLFALPAMSLIDKFGRRSLLLATTPFMAAFLALTGASFNLQSPDPGLWVTIAGLFLFVIAYSPGGGPVPFTYCAEAWPLQVRTLGMGVNTATTWLFNFLISFTFPRLVDAMGQQGVFYLYCGLNCMLQLLVWLFVPETKALSLEALDVVFATPTAEHISANWQKLAHRRGRKQTTYLERDGDVVVPWSGKIEEEVQVYETTTRSSDAT